MSLVNSTKIVPVDAFLNLMLSELSTMKYIYDSTIIGCIHAIRAQHHIGCIISDEELLEACKDALSIIQSNRIDEK